MHCWLHVHSSLYHLVTHNPMDSTCNVDCLGMCMRLDVYGLTAAFVIAALGQLGLPFAAEGHRRHHAVTALGCCMQFEVALRQWCSACRVMAAYVFCAHSVQHNGSHALIVMSSALRCVSDAMQHHAVTALGCCMQFEVALPQWCGVCRVMVAYVFCAHSVQHNGTHALIVVSSALRCVSDAMQHHAVTALGCCMQCEVALRQWCRACRRMAAYVFCAHSLQHNGTHALIVLSSALHCVSDAMQHHAVTALGCCMQCEVALRERCSACRFMAWGDSLERQLAFKFGPQFFVVVREPKPPPKHTIVHWPPPPTPPIFQYQPPGLTWGNPHMRQLAQ